jgi:Ca2+-binding EF-hand superfamily protein
MHLVAAVASLAAPALEARLLAQYLVLCIFTWCRVYMMLIQALNFASGGMYSLSITLAGFTTGSFVLGPLAVVYFVGYAALAAALWRWSGAMDLHGIEWEELTRERVRAQLLDVKAMSAWKGLPANATKAESDSAAARAFRQLDKDGSGVLETHEAARLLASMNVHSTVRRAMSDALARHGGVDFPLFLRSIWNLGARTGAEPSLAALLSLSTPREQAQAVFDSIDLDKSGVLERFELAELLVQWGCPDDEVSDYIDHIDVDGDGQIDFESEFYPKMKPIWQFGFEFVLLTRARASARAGWALHDGPDTPRAGDGAKNDGALRRTRATPRRRAAAGTADAVRSPSPVAR